MKRKTIFLVTILFCVVVLCTCSVAAWMISMYNFGVPGKATDGYFAAGDGSEENPFIITNEYHIYNLSWLHYYGYFPSGSFTHFKVQTSSADTSPTTIHMDRLTDSTGAQIALPPVGTGDTKAFCGRFDGNRSTISNLLVSIFAEDINADDSETYDFGNCLGMFGTVRTPENTDDGITTISNFNLDGVNIQVKTFDGETEATVGLVAGRAQNNVVFENVGIVKGKITAENGNKLKSAFTLIGEYMTGSGEGTQGGNDLIIDPNAETQGFVGLNGEQYGSELTGGAYIAKVTGAKNGLAYYSSTSVMAIQNGGSWYHPYTQSTQTYLDLTQNLYTLDASDTLVRKFPNGNTNLNQYDNRLYDLLNENIVAKYGAVAGPTALRNQNIIFFFGNSVNKNNLIATDSGSMIPTGGLYFTPLYSGRASVVVFVPNPSNFVAGLFKLLRGKNADGTIDYSTVAGIERIKEVTINSGQLRTVSVYNTSNPPDVGYDDAMYTGGSQIGKPLSGQPSEKFYYLFETDVVAGDEYILGTSMYMGGSSQSTFVYMVLPGINEQGGQSTIGMDFVTEDLSMWDSGYVYTNAEDSLPVTFEISGTSGAGGATLSFRRDGSATPQLLYYLSGEGPLLNASDPDKCQSSSNASFDGPTPVVAVTEKISPRVTLATNHKDKKYRLHKRRA